MDISCAFATSSDTPAHVQLAETLGYRRAWLYDSPALYPDVWMILTRCAERTARIGLGPGVLVPSLRHPIVNAAAIAGLVDQAPGRVAQEAGIPWRDASGAKLCGWMGVTDELFHDPSAFAIVPMDFYYPGKGTNGDLPPRPGFAEKWHPQLLADMPDVRLTILIGAYAQKHYLGARRAKTLTETVRDHRAYAPYFPLVHPSPSDPFSHGSDGQAENFLPAPTMPLSERHAVDLIIDLVLGHPGEIHLICTDPMTNLAMAMLKETRVKTELAGVTAISGAFGLNEHAYANATGDTPQSKWNVYVDPEAAEIVYGSGVPLVAIGLDVATYFEVDFSASDLALLDASDRPEAGFLRQAIRFVAERGYDPYCTVIDCIAAAYAIDPTLLETFTGRVGIETQGRLTYGMTVLDSRHHHAWEHLPRVEIARAADYGRFLKLLLARVLA